MMTPIFIVFLGFLCFSTVNSQSPGIFINPSPQPADIGRFGTAPLSGNAIYTVGNLLNITWNPLASGLTTIVMWQVNAEKPKNQIGDLQYLPGSSNLGTSHYTWNPIGVDGNNANPDFDLTESNVFYFALYQTNGLTPMSVTSYFNLTDSKVNAVGQSVPATTSSIASSSSSTTSSISSTTSSVPSSSDSTAAIPSSSSATSPTITSISVKDSDSSGLTTGTKVGVGLGVSFGVAILVALLVGIYLLMKRKNATHTSPSDAPTAGTEYKQEMPSAVPSPKPRLVSTYGNSSSPHELPSYH
ncbi:hypothetical protein ONS95_008975 [Cadophora gregata]|uniref:uncharacterized protein n=1 Tax=Cadophora gregata TaxID=51156 RepID=UPI0026DDCAE6|nr:uncharacterized protein ONS95_008975 [Cadophora gregata]KAK0123987.1 hypothetical protein ONS95_008975 [Cadophora gregata]KAK0130326.1 hypothetical protein ONS96_000847 [Cadophora gregata f. sp. sojae]